MSVVWKDTIASKYLRISCTDKFVSEHTLIVDITGEGCQQLIICTEAGYVFLFPWSAEYVDYTLHERKDTTNYLPLPYSVEAKNGAGETMLVLDLPQSDSELFPYALLGRLHETSTGKEMQSLGRVVSMCTYPVSATKMGLQIASHSGLYLFHQNGDHQMPVAESQKEGISPVFYHAKERFITPFAQLSVQPGIISAGVTTGSTPNELFIAVSYNHGFRVLAYNRKAAPTQLQHSVFITLTQQLQDTDVLDICCHSDIAAQELNEFTTHVKKPEVYRDMHTVLFAPVQSLELSPLKITPIPALPVPGKNRVLFLLTTVHSAELVYISHIKDTPVLCVAEMHLAGFRPLATLNQPVLWSNLCKCDIIPYSYQPSEMTDVSVFAFLTTLTSDQVLLSYVSIQQAHSETENIIPIPIPYIFSIPVTSANNILEPISYSTWQSIATGKTMYYRKSQHIAQVRKEISTQDSISTLCAHTLYHSHFPVHTTLRIDGTVTALILHNLPAVQANPSVPLDTLVGYRIRSDTYSVSNQRLIFATGTMLRNVNGELLPHFIVSNNHQLTVHSLFASKNMLKEAKLSFTSVLNNVSAYKQVLHLISPYMYPDTATFLQIQRYYLKKLTVAENDALSWMAEDQRATLDELYPTTLTSAPSEEALVVMIEKQAKLVRTLKLQSFQNSGLPAALAAYQNLKSQSHSMMAQERQKFLETAWTKHITSLRASGAKKVERYGKEYRKKEDNLWIHVIEEDRVPPTAMDTCNTLLLDKLEEEQQSRLQSLGINLD